jgi:hypothetical protein
MVSLEPKVNRKSRRMVNFRMYISKDKDKDLNM